MPTRKVPGNEAQQCVRGGSAGGKVKHRSAVEVVRRVMLRLRRSAAVEVRSPPRYRVRCPLIKESGAARAGGEKEADARCAEAGRRAEGSAALSWFLIYCEKYMLVQAYM